MSMFDDVDSAGADRKRGTDLKNPFASTGAGQNGGQSGAALPGLAAFGKMQSYTPQAPQMGQPVEQGNGHASGNGHAPAGQPQQPQPVQFIEEPPAEPVYQPEEYRQDDAALAYAGEELPEADYAYAGNGHDGHGQATDLASLAAAYQTGGDAAQPAAGQQYEYSADELHQFMAGQGEQSAEIAETEEAFDLAPHMALQTFEARYDQHPEVSLSSFEEPGEQPFFHEERQGDADFLGAGEADDQVPPPGERKSRKALMFVSGLIGALALGGALAFAYKTTGDTQLANGASPPLIKADDRPVKVTPEEPGGKQFAHQNKQIYDRLQGDEKPEVEKIVPRQENIVNSPSQGVQQGFANPGQPAQIASAQDAPGAPHRVRTLKVMPDGSVVVSAPPEEGAAAPDQRSAQAPSVPALPAPGRDASGLAVTVPTTPADQTTVASVPQAQSAPEPQAQQNVLSSSTTPAPMPQPRPAAPSRQTASIAPQAAPARSAAADSSTYVVQVASRRSQAMALAAFADLQQKYTSLLANYQPMIQSADLGDKGVWYRLRVGPMNRKGDADSLCQNLKRAGLRSCLVRPL